MSLVFLQCPVCPAYLCIGWEAFQTAGRLSPGSMEYIHPDPLNRILSTQPHTWQHILKANSTLLYVWPVPSIHASQNVEIETKCMELNIYPTVWLLSCSGYESEYTELRLSPWDPDLPYWRHYTRLILPPPLQTNLCLLSMQRRPI